MRKNIFLLFLLTAISIQAVTKMTAEQFLSIEDWQSYKGQAIQISTPLMVNAVFYDSLILSPERLFVPEERAEGLADKDSTMYYALVRENQRKSIRLEAKYYPYDIRTGAILKNLTAYVAGERRLQTGQIPHFQNNKPPRHAPKMPQHDLLICGANIQNFFYDLGGYAGAKDAEQFARQTDKIAHGLTNIDADIYALCEVEKGSKALRHLTEAMNQLKKKDVYAYVDNHLTDGDTIMVGWIYRKDKVQPYGETHYAISNPKNHYRYRMMVRGFETLPNKEGKSERLVININHPRSKRGNPAESNQKRMNNIDSLLVMMDHLIEQDVFEDPDILMMGDYNCYAMEEPIQTLVRKGYTDLCKRFAPNDYSYNYKGRSGFLDRAFASPTMNEQVVFFAPYHLNTDMFYSHGYYKGRDTTHFRYSDHDPVLVAIRFKK